MLETSNARWNAMLIEAFPRRSKKRSKLRCPCRNSKCKYNSARAPKGHADLPPHAPLEPTEIERPPTPPKDRLILEFISTIERLNLRFSWAGFLPCRIGRSPTVDSAVRAVVAAYKYRTRKNRTNADEECQSYLQAVQILRTDIDSSDDSLAAVALLTLREQVLGRDLDNVEQHDDGMAAILLARPPSAPVSDLARSILFECCRLSKTGKPLSKGVASPFQGTHWEDLEPAYPFAGTLSDAGLRLRRLSHKLSCRFPGLIADVRGVRDGTADEATTLATFENARELFHLKDDAAETTLLRGLKTTMTLDKLDRAIVPQSFLFRSPNETAVALSYWTARAIVIRNYLALISHKRGSHFLVGDEESLYFATTLAQDQVRMATHILMSWNYSSQHKLMVLLRAPLKVIWSIFTPERERSPTSKSDVQSWILRKLRDVGLSAEMTERHLDVISNALAGSPVRGPRPPSDGSTESAPASGREQNEPNTKSKAFTATFVEP